MHSEEQMRSADAPKPNTSPIRVLLVLLVSRAFRVLMLRPAFVSRPQSVIITVVKKFHASYSLCYSML